MDVAKLADAPDIPARKEPEAAERVFVLVG
jgi:hypothetical protein